MAAAAPENHCNRHYLWLHNQDHAESRAVLLFHRRQPKEEPKYTAVLFCTAGGVLGVPSTPLCRVCAFAVKNGRSSATCLGTLPKFLKYTTPPPRSPLLPRLLPSLNTLHLLPVPLYLACLLYCFCFFFCKRLVSPAPDMLSYFGGRSPNRALFSSPLFCLPSDTINSYPAIRRAVGRPWEDGPTDNA